MAEPTPSCAKAAITEPWRRHWIADQASLAHCLERCRRAGGPLSVDTEFVRERTFFPLPGLFQLGVDGDCYLVDPMAGLSLDGLAELLSDPAVDKVMHSCSEDLELFKHSLGVLPQPLFDTQVAAAFLGWGLSVGYQRLVADCLGVELDKSQTRSDWRRRPLSDMQLHYAAEDVTYLGAIYDVLHARLVEQDKLSWVEEECRMLGERLRDGFAEEQYRQISGAWRLEPRQLALLAELFRWREDEARRRDLPRSWVLGNAPMLELAARLPRSAAAIESVPELPAKTARRNTPQWLAMSDAVLQLADEALPAPLPPPLTRAQGQQVKRLRALIRARAEQAGVAVELLARRRDVEALVQGDPGQAESSVLLQGWRGRLLGEELLDALRRERAS